MNNYLLFYYRGFYPRGAFNDYISSFNSAQDVFDYIQALPETLKEEINGGSIEFQVFDSDAYSVLTLDDIDNIRDVLNRAKYSPIKKDLYFEEEWRQ